MTNGHRRKGAQEGILTAHGPFGEGIEVGCLNPAAAEAPQGIPPHGVGYDQDDILFAIISDSPLGVSASG
jgi:hypothetical protein